MSEPLPQSLQFGALLEGAQIIHWARQAGQIAMRYFRRVAPCYKADDTLVTQADLEIEHFLVTQIRMTYPDHGLICEEGVYPQATPNSPYTWVIDPLDGTTSFVQGLPGWGIALGVLWAGQPAWGLFYMPLLDDLTYTTDAGVYENGRTLRQSVQSEWGRKGFLAISPDAHRAFDIDVQRTRAVGSTGSSLVYTARDAATAAFVPRAYMWDLVAGAAILHQAGGELRYLSGRPVEYTPLLSNHLIPEPIIAGRSGLLTELQTAIQPRGTMLPVAQPGR